LERLLREATLTTLAFAIALGWAFYQAVSGLAALITNALPSLNEAEGQFGLGPLAWRLGNHVFAFAPLIQGLIEFAVVLALVLLVRRRFRPAWR
jgi:large-conductance mechanosensitive channel